MGKLKINLLSVPSTFTLILILFLTINAHAANYYEEPSESVPHAKLAYMAKQTHVLVGSIDGYNVYGDKSPQRLMPLEGAISNEYLFVTPGEHKLLMRVFHQELGGPKEISDVSSLNIHFQPDYIYYPIAEKTLLGDGKIKAVFMIIEAKSESELKARLAK